MNVIIAQTTLRGKPSNMCFSMMKTTEGSPKEDSTVSVYTLNSNVFVCICNPPKNHCCRLVVLRLHSICIPIYYHPTLHII